jgi:CheY-like chemotaxis protein
MAKIEQPNRRQPRAVTAEPAAPTALPDQLTLAADVSASVYLAESRTERTVEAQAWLNEGGAVGAPAARKPLRILIIEDDGMIAWLISETLVALGHEVCGIANCEDDAVTMAALKRPDLLLVDLHLDVGTGLNAMRRILLDGPVPHIFISGDVVSAEHLGPGALALHKPFQDADLQRAIRKAFATEAID